MTESFNDSGAEFGEQRLIEALQRHRGESSQALVSSLLDEVRQFNPNEQQDDITLIVANCRESLEPIRSEEHTSELQSQSNLVCRLLLEKKKTKPNTLQRAFVSMPVSPPEALGLNATFFCHEPTLPAIHCTDFPNRQLFLRLRSALLARM